MALALTTSTLFAQVPSYVPSNGLVGYWPFSGNANDVSGIGNNGTNNGATLTADRFGNDNSAYSFDGTTNYISVINNSSLNPTSITISGWINSNSNAVDTQNGARGIVTKWNQIQDCGGDGANFNVQLSYFDNVNVFALATSQNNQITNALKSSTDVIGLNAWKHFVFTHEPLSGQKLYIDGILIGSNNVLGDLCATTNNLYFGADKFNFGLWRYFNGKLDDIGVWNRALTQQEITNIYNSSLPQTACLPANVPITGLVGYWPFCGNANDESGNGNNGTNNGATLTADRFGNSNSAYSFDGNDWIEVFYNQILNFGTNSFTLSCWSTKQGNNTFQHLITRNYVTQWPNAVGNYALRYENNTLVLFSSGNTTTGNGTLVTSQQNNLNNWNHFVGVFNATNQTMQIYMNGNIIASGPINPNLQNYDSIGNMYFGVEHPTAVLPSGPQFLTGKLDDIGIWNRALTQEEITNLYNVNQCITNITVTDTLIINVGQLSFNDPVTWANNITIAPNPASSQININFNNITNLNGGTLKIINSLGQQVATTPITTSGTNSTLQLATWGGTGMYFVQIINPQGQIVDIKKIILQ